ncbi:hypothetical protein GUJ93_ZPchr0005g16289 [Zizania palustris]|uniref:Uncharacterized protein n=1 Tax=Zizania palustris TaxID=103762 RepID=A0A8J5T4T6_ZIZPA|nr:hypothetical protein GUJ93_ZPchr0005g16289 [Zizania palustris]
MGDSEEDASQTEIEGAEEAKDNLVAHVEAYLEQTVLRHPTKQPRRSSPVRSCCLRPLTMAPTLRRMSTTLAVATKIRRGRMMMRTPLASSLPALPSAAHPRGHPPRGIHLHVGGPMPALLKRHSSLRATGSPRMQACRPPRAPHEKIDAIGRRRTPPRRCRFSP